MPKVNLPAPSSSAPTVEINYYELDAVDAPKILAAVRDAIQAAGIIVQETSSPEQRLLKLLAEPNMVSMLTSVSRLPVFSYEMGSAFKVPIPPFPRPHSQSVLLCRQDWRRWCQCMCMCLPVSGCASHILSLPCALCWLLDIFHGLSG